MKHTHDIEKFQLWVAIGEIIAAAVIAFLKMTGA